MSHEAEMLDNSTPSSPSETATDDRPYVEPTTGDDGTVIQEVAEKAHPDTPGHLPLPATVDKHQIIWGYATGVVGIHLLSLLALLPWLFSWTGVVLAGLGCYVFGTLGINLCYHRLLTHRGLKVPPWLEHTFTVLGICCLQDTPGRWVSTHRIHHQFSDKQPDPHSPLVTFLWGHFGWLMVENKELSVLSTYEKYARDVLRDPFNLRFERNVLWLWTYLAHAALFFIVGFVVGWAWPGGTLYSGLQFGLSVFVWGVLVRTVLVWHITWSINSFTHLWGYQNYKTRENSRNNWLVALVSNGEGWHNNHHADQRAAAHGHRWWEFDVTYLTILALKRLGLAEEIVKPKAWSAPTD